MIVPLRKLEPGNSQYVVGPTRMQPGLGAGVGVSVAVTVLVAVAVAVAVLVAVAVEVAVGVSVAVAVGVLVSVGVGVSVAVAAAVGVSVGSGCDFRQAQYFSSLGWRAMASVVDHLRWHSARPASAVLPKRWPKTMSSALEPEFPFGSGVGVASRVQETWHSQLPGGAHQLYATEFTFGQSSWHSASASSAVKGLLSGGDGQTYPTRQKP